MPYSTIISAGQLQQQINELIVVDCRFALEDPTQGLSRYHRGHIPNAIYADLDQHLSSPISNTSGRHPLPNFADLSDQLGRWGIHPQTQLVAYDDMSGFFAARLWWLLKTLGHQNVAVLDGGIQAWQAAGYPIETDIPTPATCQYEALPDEHRWWDIQELQQHLTANDCVLIDARTKPRFDGDEEPIDPVAGHIPGAVNLPITDNLNAQGQFLAPAQLRKNYQALIGNTPPANVVHNCGSGVFACFGILSMEVAGLSASKLYPGSWSEWCRDPARGVATR